MTPETLIPDNCILQEPSLAHYTAQALNNCAQDLSVLLENLGRGVQAVKAAHQNSKTILGIIEEAKGLCYCAQTDLADNAALTVKNIRAYNKLLHQIDILAQEADYQGTNLLQNSSIKIVFNQKRYSYLEVNGVDARAKGLGLNRLKMAAWQTIDDIEVTIAQLLNASTVLASMIYNFGTNFLIISNRQKFTKNLINILREGADKLTLADLSEESADILELQTRQQLADSLLSLASLASQSVLKLF